jgi:hypothetical protein
MKFAKPLIAAYAVVGLLTYGHAYNTGYDPLPPLHPLDTPGNRMIGNAYLAFISSALWPMYWSVHIFKSFRPEAK